MRHQTPKKARGNAARRLAEAELGREDDGNGTCARCGVWGPVNGHERLSRAQGGDPTKPDCLLCVPCNTWCEDEPALAAWVGWKISRKHPRSDNLAANEAFNIMAGRVTFVDADEEWLHTNWPAVS
jgi:hypothetical protein